MTQQAIFAGVSPVQHRPQSWVIHDKWVQKRLMYRRPKYGSLSPSRGGLPCLWAIKIVRHLSFNCHPSARIKILLAKHWPKKQRLELKTNVNLLKMARKLQCDMKFATYSCPLPFRFALWCVLFSNILVKGILQCHWITFKASLHWRNTKSTVWKA